MTDQRKWGEFKPGDTVQLFPPETRFQRHYVRAQPWPKQTPHGPDCPMCHPQHQSQHALPAKEVFAVSVIDKKRPSQGPVMVMLDERQYRRLLRQLQGSWWRRTIAWGWLRVRLWWARRRR